MITQLQEQLSFACEKKSRGLVDASSRHGFDTTDMSVMLGSSW
jgi:hypothetical protein